MVETDILIIGGGVAGLSAAIHIAEQTANANPRPNILVIEKGNEIGSHTLSGAVIDTSTLLELLGEEDFKSLPFETIVTTESFYYLTRDNSFCAPFTPPFMGNKGKQIVSLGRLVKRLSEIAEQKGVQIYPGFSVSELIFDGSKVIGAKIADTGIDKNAKPMDNFQAGDKVYAKVTVLAEGARGSLTQKLIQRNGLDEAANAQVYSVGVKELWEIPEGNFEVGKVIHTLGYPFSFNHFGGGFVYGINSRQVAVGIAAGLDYSDPTFDSHGALQIYKKHPLLAKILKGGRPIRYGAKTIPEGGLFSIPKFYTDGAVIVGDSAGFLSMPSLKGAHLAVASGIFAAKSIAAALDKKDFSAEQLSLYEKIFKESAAYKTLFETRNFRAAFEDGMVLGAVRFGTQILTKGRGLVEKLSTRKDSETLQPISKIEKPFCEKFARELEFDKKLTFDKVTDVYFSKTHHDEEQPCHLRIKDKDACRKICIPKFGAPCQYFCPAEVYEVVTDSQTGEKELHLHPANCLHCKTCEIKDPFENIEWTVPFGGDGPEYESL